MVDPIGAKFARVAKIADGKAETRKKLVGAMRAACARLKLDDDARRDLFEEVTGKRSSTDMTLAEMGKVLDRLNKDWKGPSGHRAHIAKIRALWWTLYWLAEINADESAVDKALDAFVKRQTGLDSLKFVDHRAAPAIIEALKAWAARAGVEWPTAERVADVGVDAALVERAAVADAIWKKLDDRRLVRGLTPFTYIRNAVGLCLNHWAWTARDWDAGIRILGKKLQHAIASERLGATS